MRYALSRYRMWMLEHFHAVISSTNHALGAIFNLWSKTRKLIYLVLLLVAKTCLLKTSKNISMEISNRNSKNSASTFMCRKTINWFLGVQVQAVQLCLRFKEALTTTNAQYAQSTTAWLADVSTIEE